MIRDVRDAETRFSEARRRTTYGGEISLAAGKPPEESNHERAWHDAKAEQLANGAMLCARTRDSRTATSRLRRASPLMRAMANRSYCPALAVTSGATHASLSIRTSTTARPFLTHRADCVGAVHSR